MHLIVYGPEGSGKGTQAGLLSGKLNVPIITSGDLVRQEAKYDHTQEGRACLKALKTGRYVSDEIMFKLWEKKLESQKAKQGFILDGFPRNINQAKFLINTVSKNGYSIDKFIHIGISEGESYRRLIKRNRKLFTGSTISHDTPRKIKSRLSVYRKNEKETVGYFKKLGLLIEIDGEKDMDEVFRSIITEIKKVS